MEVADNIHMAIQAGESLYYAAFNTIISMAHRQEVPSPVSIAISPLLLQACCQQGNSLPTQQASNHTESTALTVESTLPSIHPAEKVVIVVCYYIWLEQNWEETVTVLSLLPNVTLTAQNILVALDAKSVDDTKLHQKWRHLLQFPSMYQIYNGLCLLNQDQIHSREYMRLLGRFDNLMDNQSYDVLTLAAGEGVADLTKELDCGHWWMVDDTSDDELVWLPAADVLCLLAEEIAEPVCL